MVAGIDQHLSGEGIGRLGAIGIHDSADVCVGGAIDWWGVGGSAVFGKSFVCMVVVDLHRFIGFGIWQFGCALESGVVFGGVGCVFDPLWADLGVFGDDFHDASFTA
jgi:hypothetical protein